MIEDEDDLSAGVEVGVIVVVKLRRGDSEAREYDGRLHVDVARKEADEVFEKLVALLRPGTAQHELRLLHVRQVLDERHGLQERSIDRWRESRLGVLGGDELHRHLRSRGE